jgi:S-adenosylmethionine:tRNA ribosyltransferase-isomerase
VKTELFNYHLPKGLIAQLPVHPRDHSRLLVFDRKTKKTIHDHFYNLVDYLKPSDVLVFNDTKVFPARLFGKKESGGKMEVFLLKSLGGKTWEVLIGGKVRQVGQSIIFRKGLRCQTMQRFPDGIWQARFNKPPKLVMALANEIGSTPTPPYVKKLAKLSDYQTVYAKQIGSVAAPTAGFHFTKKLLDQLKKKGIQFEYITLHVGFGTFQPVKVDDIREHRIHEEYAEVDKVTAKRLWKAKQQGRRIIAVGTTTVRTLETAFQKYEGSDRALARSRSKAKARVFAYPHIGLRGWINTFIYPGYKFKFVDAIITNFHLPESSLLMLVSAFAGRKKILGLYEKAVRKRYRFYSFGDGMMIV